MMKTYRHIIAFFVVVTLLFSACSKDSLDLSNPNQPVPANLKTPDGLKKIGFGIFYQLYYTYWWWWAGGDLNCMADLVTISVGNYNWRWANQTTSITLSNGTVITPPDVGTQPELLKTKNDRTIGNDNTFLHEWRSMYLVIGQANYILEIVDDAEVSDAFKNTMKAWAYWWKGLSYSRIGSLYEVGLIVDTYNETNNSYVSYTAILSEAAASFDKSLTLLNAMPAAGNSDYNDVMDYLIPNESKAGRGGVPTPAEWARAINTYKARNILANKYAKDLTSADLLAMKALADNGLQATDKIFTIRHASINSLVGGTPAWTPGRVMSMSWERISERFVQDFKQGDKRKDRNMKEMVPSKWMVNPSSRGFQYGSRWEPIAAETGGGEWFSQSPNAVEIPLACTYEENLLILAECAIRSDDIETGLGYIDDVRTHQNAGLAAVKGTGLTKDQALEELRRERRVGLFQNYVGFYDARRWEVIKDVSQGGGRTGAVVVLGQNYPGFPGGVDYNATINYNYLERFDVPAGEIELNPMTSMPSGGSAVNEGAK